MVKAMIYAMKKQLLNYSLKQWLTMSIVSFTLFQVPLYYMVYKANLGFVGDSYGTLLIDFTKNWARMISLLIIPAFIIFRCVRALYQPYWSTRGFKLALLLVSEFVMSF